MKTCFVIAPIGESGSETRRRSDLVLKYVITPAAERCGYTALRADQISEPGLITSQVIQHIVDDPLVIADLTERNPNVFYELAIRHALRKPLVQIIKAGDQMPFDVAGTRTIPVDHRDLESVEVAKQEIVRQIETLEKMPQEIETPISVAIELQILRQSENPEERSFAELLTSIADIKAEIATLQKNTSLNDLRRLESMLATLVLSLHEIVNQVKSVEANAAHMSEIIQRDAAKSYEGNQEFIERFEHVAERLLRRFEDAVLAQEQTRKSV